MSRQAAPSGVTYDETFTPEGLGLRLLDVDGVTVVHVVYSKDKTVHVFHVVESGTQSTARLTDTASGQQYTAAPPFWSVLWTGRQGNATAAQSAVIADTRDRMIYDLLTNSAASYAPSLVGAETLNGIPVYRLHLTAQDAANHPLTDLFVDERTFLVRRAIAEFRDSSVTDVTGSVTLNFDGTQSYWLVTSGEIEATVHAFLTQVSGSATFSATNVVLASPPL
jgi:hypothetical protein